MHKTTRPSTNTDRKHEKCTCTLQFGRVGLIQHVHPINYTMQTDYIVLFKSIVSFNIVPSQCILDNQYSSLSLHCSLCLQLSCFVVFWFVGFAVFFSFHCSLCCVLLSLSWVSSLTIAPYLVLQCIFVDSSIETFIVWTTTRQHKQRTLTQNHENTDS